MDSSQKPRPRPTPRFSQRPLSPTRRRSTPALHARSVQTRTPISVSSDSDGDIATLTRSPRRIIRASPLIAVKNEERDLTSEEEVLANATHSNSSAVSSLHLPEPTVEQDGRGTDENNDDEGEGDDEDEDEEQGGVEADPTTTSLDNRTGQLEKTASESTAVDDEDDEQDGNLPRQPSEKALGKRRALTSPKPSPSSASPSEDVPKSPRLPTSMSDDLSEDDTFLAPHALFNQSQQFAASQHQRKLADQVLNDFRDHDEEDEGQKIRIKTETSEPMSIPNAAFSASARKRVPSPEIEYIVIESSPEPEVAPPKGSFNRVLAIPFSLIQHAVALLKRQAEAASTDAPQPKRSRTDSDEVMSPNQSRGGMRSLLSSPHKQRNPEIPINEFKRDEDLWYV